MYSYSTFPFCSAMFCCVCMSPWCGKRVRFIFSTAHCLLLYVVYILFMYLFIYLIIYLLIYIYIYIGSLLVGIPKASIFQRFWFVNICKIWRIQVSIQDPHKYGNMHVYFQTRSGWFLARQVHPPLPWQIGKSFSVSKPPGTLRRINQEQHQKCLWGSKKHYYVHNKRWYRQWKWSMGLKSTS